MRFGSDSYKSTDATNKLSDWTIEMISIEQK